MVWLFVFYRWCFFCRSGGGFVGDGGVLFVGEVLVGEVVV